MTRRTTPSTVNALGVATMLAMLALAPTAAAAQEAITLETIGAVRMVRPDEVERSSPQLRTTPAVSEAAHVEHHADNQ